MYVIKYHIDLDISTVISNDKSQERKRLDVSACAILFLSFYLFIFMYICTLSYIIRNLYLLNTINNCLKLQMMISHLPLFFWEIIWVCGIFWNIIHYRLMLYTLTSIRNMKSNDTEKSFELYYSLSRILYNIKQYQIIFLNAFTYSTFKFQKSYDSNFATPMFTFAKNSFQWTTNNDSSKVD